MPNQPKEIARFPPVNHTVHDIENGPMKPMLEELPMFGRKNRRIADLENQLLAGRELIAHVQDELATVKSNARNAEVISRKQNTKLRGELSSLRGPNIGLDGGQSALDGYFGLGRTNWFTLPRVLMNGMNDRWKYKMSVLLNQFDAEYENMDWENIDVHVHGRRGGKVTKIPSWWGDYRHANKAKVDAARTAKKPQE